MPMLSSESLRKRIQIKSNISFAKTKLLLLLIILLLCFKVRLQHFARRKIRCIIKTESVVLHVLFCSIQVANPISNNIRVDKDIRSRS